MAEKLKVGMLGCAFMGKAHIAAYKRVHDFMEPVPALPVMEAVCGLTEAEAEGAKRKYGFARSTTDWHSLVDDPGIDILDNVSPNYLHADPCIAALRAGKHTLVEKPMTTSVQKAQEMLLAAEEAEKHGVKHMVCHNYRYVPALQLARRLIREGKLGEIYQFRTVFPGGLLDPAAPLSWRMQKELAGYGVHGDLNAHSIDICRFLTGLEFNKVMGWSKQFTFRRPLPGKPEEMGDVTTEDVAMFYAELSNGAPATFEATNFSTGIGGRWTIEVHGSKGAVLFNMLRLNELGYYSCGDELEEQGIRAINLAGTSENPFMKYYWPKGHSLGWEHNHSNLIFHFLDCIAGNKDVGEIGCTFQEGFRNQLVLDAAWQSMEHGGQWVDVPKL